MLHFFTGFGMQQNSATAALYNGIWDEVSNPGFGTAATVGAPFAGHGYLSFTQNSGFLGRPLKSNAAHLFVGFRLTRNQFPAGSPACIFTLNDGTTEQVRVAVGLSSEIQLYRGATLVSSTAINVVPAPGIQWDYYECEISIHPSAGVFTVKKNGNTILSATALNTRSTANSYANRFRVGSPSNNGNCIMTVTDLVVCDDQAGSGPTTFTGDIRAEPLTPNGAGNNTDWTPSAGANYQCVDDVPANEDTDFNASATVGNKDRYAFTDMPAGMSGNILALNHQYRARKDDAGVRSVTGQLRSSASETAGATNSLGTSYQNYEDQYFVDPNGGGALTIAAVNAIQAGLDVAA